MQIGKRFSEFLIDNVMNQFLDIQLSGSVTKYHDEFEPLSVYLPPIPENIMMSTFSKGLKCEIKAKLSRETFTKLRELMDATFKVEKILSALYKAYHEKFLRKAWVYGHAKASSLVQQWPTQTCSAKEVQPLHPPMTNH